MSEPVVHQNVLPLSAKPTAAVVMVDPDTARRWLGRNTHNRGIRKSVVSNYARDMANGDWHITGEAIKFDMNNVLRDGQHRLLAVIEADACVPMFVVRGLRPESQMVMDTGSKRLASDALSLDGYENAAMLAAAARWALVFDQDLFYTDHKNWQMTHSQIREYVLHNPALGTACHLTGTWRKHIDLAPSLIAVSVFLTSRVDRGDSVEFFSRLADGIGLEQGSPILALRSRLRQLKNDHAKIEPDALLSLVIRAWNAYRSGRRIATIPIYVGKKSIRCPQPK